MPISKKPRTKKLLSAKPRIKKVTAANASPYLLYPIFATPGFRDWLEQLRAKAPPGEDLVELDLPIQVWLQKIWEDDPQPVPPKGIGIVSVVAGKNIVMEIRPDKKVIGCYLRSEGPMPIMGYKSLCGGFEATTYFQQIPSGSTH